MDFINKPVEGTEGGEQCKRISMEEILELGDDCLGLKVVIYTREHSWMGIISYILTSSKRIGLEKVCDPKSGRRMMGLRHFLFKEIMYVDVIGEDKEARQRLLREVYQEAKRGKQLLMKKLVPSHLLDECRESSNVDEDILLGRKNQEVNLMPPPPPPPRVKRPEKWIVIHEIDEAFKKAMSVIRNQTEISVGMEGKNLGRSGTLAWLSISTSTIIFLFEMVNIGPDRAFEEGLKEILMDESLLKIVHDGRTIEDYLYHNFQISLNNVFDTQAAEVYLHMKSNRNSVPSFVSGLPSLLIRYLKLSPHHVFFSHVRQECQQNDESVWFERPLPDYLCEGLARSVMYLSELRLVLLKLMLVDLSQVTNLHIGSLRDKDSTTAERTELHVVPAEIQKLVNRKASNFIDVHDPYIAYSRDILKIISHPKKSL